MDKEIQPGFGDAGEISHGNNFWHSSGIVGADFAWGVVFVTPWPANNKIREKRTASMLRGFVPSLSLPSAMDADEAVRAKALARSLQGRGPVAHQPQQAEKQSSGKRPVRMANSSRRQSTSKKKSSEGQLPVSSGGISIGIPSRKLHLK